jgi:signal transduction histidine kinase
MVEMHGEYHALPRTRYSTLVVQQPSLIGLRRMLRATAFVLLVGLGCGVASAQAVGDAVAAKRVLALYADDRLLPAVQQGEAGLRAGLAAGPPTGIEYFGEFFHAGRFPMAGHGEVMHAYLLAKYRESPPDVLVAGGRAALLFLLDHRQTLFPGTPIVFMGLSGDEVPADRLDANVTGLPGSWELLPALELALRLQPDTTRMVVISGASSRDQELLAPLREAATRAAGRVSFTWLTDRTLAQLKTEVAALPRGTVALFVSHFQDAAGQFYQPREVLEILAPLTSVPIYGLFESQVGYGLVGGTMQTWTAVGQAAATLVKRTLAGAAPQAAAQGLAMPVSTIVDWRQVQRWGIDESRLPPGTDIRFRQPTLWEAYRTQAVILTAVGVAQLMLIAALAVALQRRRAAEATRLQAEVRAAQLRDELAHSSRVTMMGELATTLAHEINQPLAAILSNAQATRRWLRADHPNLDEVRATVDDIIADDKRAGEIIHRMRALMKKGDRKPQRIDLATAIRDVAALLQGEIIAADVTLRLDLPPEGLPVDADEVATQQVLLNLMMNGIQAMKESGARIRQLHVHAARAGESLVVTVHDTGTGISEETRARLFEPFFTTKTTGLGVGLGICRRIAEAHGGRLDVGVAPTGGATFLFSLPTPETAS